MERAIFSSALHLQLFSCNEPCSSPGQMPYLNAINIFLCFFKFFFSKRAFLTLSPSSVWDAECFPEKASVPTSYSTDSNLLQKLFVIIQSTTCLGSLMSITRHIRTPKPVKGLLLSQCVYKLSTPVELNIF